MIRVCLSNNQITRRLPWFGLANAIAFAVTLIANASTLQAGIVPTWGYVESGIYTNGGFAIAANGELSYPASGESASSSADWAWAENRSVTSVTFEQIGSKLVYTFTFDQGISGTEKSEGYAYFFCEIFADEDIRYSLSGTFSLVGTAGTHLQSALDGATGTYFEQVKESRSTPNQSLTVEGADTGDYLNYVSGFPSANVSGGGYLTAGGLVYIHSFANGDSASASGTIQITFEPASAPVPEPTSIVAMGVGLGGLALSWRRWR